MIEACAISNKTKEINYMFPLRVQASGDSHESRDARKPNLSPEFVAAFRSRVGLDFLSNGPGDLDVSFGPEDVFHYIYAVLHSPEYRDRYADFLKSDFPRVPLPGDHAVFVELARLGGALTTLHLLQVADEDPTGAWHFASLAMGDSRVDKIRYAPPEAGRPGKVWINRNACFEGVAREVWAFQVGGYRPAEKWLKDRKGRVLTNEELIHYGKIVGALGETINAVREIDAVIDRHGGWPAAFSVTPGESADIEVVQFSPRIVEPAVEERYVKSVPLIPLRAAAGVFGDPQSIEEDRFEWVEVDSRRPLRPGMFVAQVVGRSMQPVIPDGAWCLFRAPVEGTRQGRTVLVQLRDSTDPETGDRYTVKRYDSAKTRANDSWRHRRIMLRPVNPDFDPIVLSGTDEEELQVIAEFVEVLGR